MSATHRIVALPILGAALAAIAFGIVRGATDPGPASGVRLVVTVEPPIDEPALAMAERVVRERIDGAAVVIAGGRLVVEVAELGEGDVHRIERTATLEVRSGPVALAPRAIARARVAGGGVAIAVADPSALARFAAGMPIEVVFDGKVLARGSVERVAGDELYVGAPEPAALAASIEAGAVHPLHVASQARFTRTTGFLPRSWPFLAVAAVLVVVVAVLWRRRG